MHKMDVFDGARIRRKKYIVTIFIFILIIAALVALTLTFGTKTHYILMKLRLPRIIAAILCGLAFGVAGNTFQTLLGNPLASPDIIGVSSGSTVAAVYGILFLHANRGVVSLMAVLAGLLTAVLIYRVAYNGAYSTTRLILTGIGVQAFFTALINWMVMRAAEYDVPTAMRWMTGNLSELSTDAIPILLVIVTVTVLIIAGLRNSLRGLELGDAYATILGIKVNVARIALIICSVVLIAFATAVSGPISSIAFLSGPIATRICGKNHTNTLSAGLMGAIIVLASDFVGQNLLPTRYPVGVITGLLGAPYLLYLLISINRGERV